MSKYYQIPIKIISIITLAAFVLTNIGISYAFEPQSRPTTTSKLRQIQERERLVVEIESAADRIVFSSSPTSEKFIRGLSGATSIFSGKVNLNRLNVATGKTGKRPAISYDYFGLRDVPIFDQSDYARSSIKEMIYNALMSVSGPPWTFVDTDAEVDVAISEYAQEGVLRISVRQATCTDSEWKVLENNENGFRKDGISFLITTGERKSKKHFDHWGLGLSYAGLLLNGQPQSILIYSRNPDASCGLQTDLYLVPNSDVKKDGAVDTASAIGAPVTAKAAGEAPEPLTGEADAAGLGANGAGDANGAASNASSTASTILTSMEESLIDRLWKEFCDGHEESCRQIMSELTTGFKKKHGYDSQALEMGGKSELDEFADRQWYKNRDLVSFADYMSIDIALDRAIENIYQHGENRGILLLRFQVINDKLRVICIFLDRGNGFVQEKFRRYQLQIIDGICYLVPILLDEEEGSLDRRKKHAPIHEAVLPHTSLGRNGGHGDGSYFMQLCFNYISITSVDMVNGNSQAYYWEKGDSSERVLESAPVEHGTKIVCSADFSIVERNKSAAVWLQPNSASAAGEVPQSPETQATASSGEGSGQTSDAAARGAIGANIHSNNEIYLDKLQAVLDRCVEPVQARLRQSGVNCAIKPIIVGSAYALSDDQNTVDANKIGDIDIWLEIDNKDVGSAAAREYATELTARLQGVVSGSVVLGPRFDSHSNAISERVTIYGFFTDQTKGLPVNIGVADDIASRLAAGAISTSKSYLENAGDDSDIIRDFWARKFITAWLSAERFAGNTDTHRRMRQFYLDNFQNPEMVAQEIIDSGRDQELIAQPRTAGTAGAADARAGSEKAVVSNTMLGVIDFVLSCLNSSVFEDNDAIEKVSLLKTKLAAYNLQEAELNDKIRDTSASLEDLLRLRIEILETVFAQEQILRDAMESAKIQEFPDGSRGLMYTEEVDDFEQSMRQVSEDLELLREHLEKLDQAPSVGRGEPPAKRRRLTPEEAISNLKDVSRRLGFTASRTIDMCERRLGIAQALFDLTEDGDAMLVAGAGSDYETVWLGLMLGLDAYYTDINEDKVHSYRETTARWLSVLGLANDNVIKGYQADIKTLKTDTGLDKVKVLVMVNVDYVFGAIPIMLKDEEKQFCRNEIIPLLEEGSMLILSEDESGAIRKALPSHLQMQQLAYSPFKTFVGGIAKVYEVVSTSVPPAEAPAAGTAGAAGKATVDGRAIGEHELFAVLKGKYDTRNILRGGPIKQPSFFCCFNRNEGAVRRKLTDKSYSAALVDSADVWDFKKFAEEIASGRMELPLVYKPNGGALGNGVFFLEKDSANNNCIRFTMAYVGKPVELKVERYLNDRNIAVVKPSGEHIMQVVLDPSALERVGNNAADILYGIWVSVTSSDPFSYDSGMMESMLQFMQYEGKAYETRFRIKGDLATGECVLIKKSTSGEEGSFARVGSSEYFSNRTYREEAAYRIEYPDMYEPLCKEYVITRESLEQYADDMIKAEFRYLSERLKEIGIFLKECVIEGEFDVKWLPPNEKSAGFPVPVLIEARIARIVTAPGIGLIDPEYLVKEDLTVEESL